MMDMNVTEPQVDPDNGFANPNDTGVKRIRIHVRHIQALDINGTAQRATIFGAYAIQVTDAPAIYIGMSSDRSRECEARKRQTRKCKVRQRQNA